MPEGGVLKVEVSQVEVHNHEVFRGAKASGVFVKLRVADTGVGMDEDTKRRMFEPFFTTKEVGEGTGLGLSTVFGIVEQHGGFISVTSEKEKGAVFDVLLPIQDTSEQKVISQDGGKDPAGNETLLFVDDEEAIVQMAINGLERYGYRVKGFTKPEEALRSFRKAPGKFDLAVMDRLMPTVTGEKLASEIFRISPRTPLLLCTGNPEGINKERIATFGLSKVVRKPYTLEHLARVIRGLLDSKQR